MRISKELREQGCGFGLVRNGSGAVTCLSSSYQGVVRIAQRVYGYSRKAYADQHHIAGGGRIVRVRFDVDTGYWRIVNR